LDREHGGECSHQYPARGPGVPRRRSGRNTNRHPHGAVTLLNDFFDSTIELLRPIPPLAWVPLALAWFKIGLTSIVFIIFIGAFFPILLNTVDGVRSVKKTWLEVATTLGAKERQIMTKVVLPRGRSPIWTVSG
jgi:NitT/TauT family transport system permease protein